MATSPKKKDSSLAEVRREVEAEGKEEGRLEEGGDKGYVKREEDTSITNTTTTTSTTPITITSGQSIDISNKGLSIDLIGASVSEPHTSVLNCDFS